MCLRQTIGISMWSLCGRLDGEVGGGKTFGRANTWIEPMMMPWNNNL
jgi:hypothetical protein